MGFNIGFVGISMGLMGSNMGLLEFQYSKRNRKGIHRIRTIQKKGVKPAKNRIDGNLIKS